MAEADSKLKGIYSFMKGKLDSDPTIPSMTERYPICNDHTGSPPSMESRVPKALERVNSVSPVRRGSVWDQRFDGGGTESYTHPEKYSSGYGPSRLKVGQPYCMS